MPSTKQHIAKGFYQYSQLNRFISVKDYIFSRVENKKCLLIRFSNDMDYPVDSMTFTVVELNGSGKKIAEKKITYEGIRIDAGATYVSERGIVVENDCRDFKIYFSCVRSGKYKYVVKNGEVSVLYDQNPPKVKKKSNSKKINSSFSVTPIGKNKQRLATLTSVLALILILATCVGNLYSLYRKELEKREEREERNEYTDQGFYERETEYIIIPKSN